LFIGSQFTLHASFPHSVTLMQLRFTSLTVISSWPDLHQQECAHVGRTKKKPSIEGFVLPKIPAGLTSLAGALAGVLLATRCHATLQADALATATGRQGEAGLGGGTGRCFAVCFGNDFVAHLNFQEKK
jgi:hypothetical protein